MLELDRKSKLFAEKDQSLARQFAEAGIGFPQEGALLLHPLEAGYLLSRGQASFEGSLGKFLPVAKKLDKNFEFSLAAYTAIRSTGRIVRPFMQKTHYLRAYAPGVGREEDRPSQLVCLLPGKTPSAKTLEDEVKVAHLARLDLVIATGTPQEIRFHKISSFKF